MHTSSINTETIGKTLCVLYRCLKDPQLPYLPRILIFLLVAYLLSPIDLIPDFIPVIGLLDEIILLPVVLTWVIKLIPEDIWERHDIDSAENFSALPKIAGFILVAGVWAALFFLTLKLLDISFL